MKLWTMTRSCIALGAGVLAVAGLAGCSGDSGSRSAAADTSAGVPPLKITSNDFNKTLTMVPGQLGCFSGLVSGAKYKVNVRDTSIAQAADSGDSLTGDDGSSCSPAILAEQPGTTKVSAVEWVYGLGVFVDFTLKVVPAN